MRKKSELNIVLALISQIATALIGMLLPRALMANYGSATNGLITSLQQIVSYLSLIEGGLLSAVAVSLYKPVADNDVPSVNRILAAAKHFYRRTGIVFLIALIALALIYPVATAQYEYSYWEIAYIVLLIGVNGATQILFIGKYKALLMASQNNGVTLVINAASTCLYSALLIVFSYCKINIFVGLTISVCAYLIRALSFYIATKILLPQYNFSGNRENVSFPQRGDALIAQLLNLLALNGGVIILSICQASMEEISVYTTYNLVLSAIFMLMYSVENTMTSVFGKTIAEGNLSKLQSSYQKFDTAFSMLLSVISGCLLTLMLPFIQVYTSGVDDVQYVRVVEGGLFCIVCILWIIRNQQTLLMTARGDFKKMSRATLIEACIVMAAGAVLYLLFDLKGFLLAKITSEIVAIALMGTFTYRDILNFPLTNKMINLILSAASAITTYFLASYILKQMGVANILDWFVAALLTGIISVVVTVVVWFLFKKKDMLNLLHAMIRK